MPPQAEFDKVVVTSNLLDGWQRRQPQNGRAVLFVHGFLGDPEETWRLKKGLVSFPELLTQDPSVQDFDSFRFQYKSRPFSGPDIKNIAQQLDKEIIAKLGGHQLVLVAHSMGGLVCMQYVVDRLERGEPLPVRGLLMYGTPTNGVEWITIAKLAVQLAGLKFPGGSLLQRVFGANSQVDQLSPQNQYLFDLQRNWVQRVINGGNPAEPAERRAWLPVRVVTGNDDWVVQEDSAKWVYDREDWHPTQFDHCALVKPDNAKHVCYQRAVEFLDLCRHSLAADAAFGLRSLMDWVRSQGRGKLIRDWSLEVRFRATDAEWLGPGPRMQGFSACEVSCTYTLLLADQKPLLLGLTVGGDASRKAWEGNPAYLHQIFPGAMTDAERQESLKALRARLKDPKKAWDRLFENVRFRIAEAKTANWHDLIEDRKETSDDGVLGFFRLPEAALPLLGREVTLDLGFRSLRPNALHEFTLQFPWLTVGFRALFSVDGESEYLLASPQLFGPEMPKVEPPEHYGEGQKLSISGKGQVVLPGSSVRIAWLPR